MKPYARNAGAIAFCIAALLALPAHAAPAVTTLGELFAIARESEPGYLAAKASVAASKARTRQAFGAMLPQLTANATANGNRRRYDTLGSSPSTLHDRYHADTDQVSLTQPLWHAANNAALREARDGTAQAEYQLMDTEQQLYVKLATAWFDLMQARDEVKFTTAQREALRAQWEIARRAATLGAQGEPQAEEAHAKFEEASADEASAEMDVASKLAAVEQWVGPADDLQQPYLKPDAELPDLIGDDLDAWLEQVDTHSPAVLAAARAITAADEEVAKQHAGHQPTLDLVASYGKNAQAVGNFPGQAGYDIRTLTVGLQLNVPLYSGGTQSAKVAEALAMRDKAYDDMVAARRQAILSIKDAFYGWHAGAAKARAARIAVSAAETGLAAATRGSAKGLKTEADVLAAQQQLAGARRDMLKGRYQQLTAFIKLKATLGELSITDVDELDNCFSAQTQVATR
jgi:outer membrane protein